MTKVRETWSAVERDVIAAIENNAPTTKFTWGKNNSVLLHKEHVKGFTTHTLVIPVKQYKKTHMEEEALEILGDITKRHIDELAPKKHYGDQSFMYGVRYLDYGKRMVGVHVIKRDT